MKKYIITQDYYDQYSDILDGTDFEVGAQVTQGEDDYLSLVQEESKGAHTSGDPILPPPHPPKVPL